MLLNNAKKSVTQSYYEKDPFIVINVKRNMITARHEQKNTRNATYFKKINSENEFDDLEVNPDNRDKSDSNTSTPVRSSINTKRKSGYVAT